MTQQSHGSVSLYMAYTCEMSTPSSLAVGRWFAARLTLRWRGLLMSAVGGKTGLVVPFAVLSRVLARSPSQLMRRQAPTRPPGRTHPLVQGTWMLTHAWVVADRQRKYL